MRILVCIKQVPGTSNVAIDEETGVLKRSGVESKMNPYDLFALETALRFKDSKTADCVTVLSMGPPQAEAVLREAVYMGADDGILLTDRKFGGADVVATSYTLAQGVKLLGGFDLILCGKQTTDGDTAQVGAEMSEWLQIPYAANVCQIDHLDRQSVTVRTGMEKTIQVQEMPLPCLLSMEKDVCTPRLPSYKRKLELGEPEIRRLSLEELMDKDEAHYGLSGSPTQVERIFPPAVSDEKEIWNGSPEELAQKLYALLNDMRMLESGVEQ